MNYRNLAELHRVRAEQSGPRLALRYKRFGLYAGLSWEDYRERAVDCAAALVDVGMKVGDRVGLLAENRLEWQLQQWVAPKLLIVDELGCAPRGADTPRGFTPPATDAAVVRS